MSPPSFTPPGRRWRRPKRGASAATPERIREEVAEVKEIVLGLERLDKSSTLYPPGSQVLKQQLEDQHERMTRFLQRMQALELTVAADEIEFEGEVVYDAAKSTDKSNIAYTLEDGGIRRLVFLNGLERAELQGFCDALKDSRGPEAEDLVTLLWMNGLRHVSYVTVNFFAEPIEQSIEELLQQSTRATIVDRLRNRELEIDQIAMVRSDHPSEAADADLPEIFALSPQDLAETQRRIAEYQGDSGLVPYCRVVLSLLMHDQSEEACRVHLATLQDSVINLVEEGFVGMAADVVDGVRRIAEETSTYGSARAQLVALRGFVAAVAKKELGARMREHLGRARTDAREIVAYIRALGKHAVYLGGELLGTSSDDLFVHAIAEGCGSDFGHVRDFVADPNAKMAAAAVRILSAIAGDGGRVDYIKASSHPDPGVRREAFIALAQCKDERALDKLLSAFGDADPEIRLSALRAFGGCLLKPRPELYPRVFELIESPKFWTRPPAEQEALYAVLGKLDPARSVPYLTKKLVPWSFMTLFRRKEAHREKILAASALAEVATEEAESILKRQLKSEDEQLYKACRLALDRLEVVRISARQHAEREKQGFEPDRSGAMSAFNTSRLQGSLPGKLAADRRRFES
jgi:hypothetical protein